MDDKSKELMKLIKEVLPKKRYMHTLGVAYLSSSLAMCYGFDNIKAFQAGLLHDCAKYEPDNIILDKCDNLKLDITTEQRMLPHLLHGILGEYYARTLYKIDDADILNAIKYHTTGRTQMSLLEKIVFVADYIEIGRTQPTNPPLDEIRKIAFSDIDRAVYLVAENVIRYLTETGSQIDSTTFEVLDYYKNIMRSKKHFS